MQQGPSPPLKLWRIPRQFHSRRHQRLWRAGRASGGSSESSPYFMLWLPQRPNMPIQSGFCCHFALSPTLESFLFEFL